MNDISNTSASITPLKATEQSTPPLPLSLGHHTVSLLSPSSSSSSSQSSLIRTTATVGQDLLKEIPSVETASLSAKNISPNSKLDELDKLVQRFNKASPENQIKLFNEASSEDMETLLDLLDQIEPIEERIQIFKKLHLELLSNRSVKWIWSQLSPDEQHEVLTQRGQKLESEILQKLPIEEKNRRLQYLLYKQPVEELLLLLPKERIESLNKLPLEKLRAMLQTCSIKTCLKILDKLPTNDQVKIFERLPTNMAFQVFNQLPDKDRELVRTTLIKNTNSHITTDSVKISCLKIEQNHFKKQLFSNVEKSAKNTLTTLLKNMPSEERLTLFTEESLLTFAQQEYPKLNNLDDLKKQMKTEQFMKKFIANMETNQLYIAVSLYLLRTEEHIQNSIGALIIFDPKNRSKEDEQLLHSIRTTIQAFHDSYTTLTKNSMVSTPEQEKLLDANARTKPALIKSIQNNQLKNKI